MAGEKRSQDQEETLAASTVLVDIEGTTTSISFVKDTLFPYVRQNLKNYIESKWEDEEFKQDYEKLKEQAKKDEEDKVDGFVAITGDKPEEEKDSLLKNILWQMDNDRKTGALKQLQGHMWRQGYEAGTLKPHVYEDVPKALESWTNDGKKIYIYSSGSVEAQKLLFGHTEYGDMLKYFSGFFDTEVGAKQETDSYKNILSKINEKPSNVVFLTDVVKEAAAAKEAGLSTVIVIREGNAAITDEEKATFTTVNSFLDLTFQMSAKRQKLETTDEKVNEGITKDVSEPMDTSEDVEMTDVSDKKIEKDDAKEVTEKETTEHVKSQSSEDASTSLAQKEEPMVVVKDSSNTEQKTLASETTETDVKSEDTSEKKDSSESTEQTVKDDTAASAAKDSDKVAASEKTEENSDTPTTEVSTPVADDSMDTSMPESALKSESASTSTEKKTEESAEVAKDTQPEVVDKTQTIENDKKEDDVGPETQSSDKNVADKTEESLTAEKDEVKEESKTVSGTSESEEVSAKSEQEEVAKTETTAKDVTENGETTEVAIEKTTVSPTVTEPEATTSTTDAKREASQSNEVSQEKKVEVAAEPEKADEKTPQVAETEETVATDAEKCENEATKQEPSETVKEENVVDVKDKNTVDSEKQKLNGTTQNGNTEVPVLDDKLHSNGLNEGPSKETTSEDAAATAQNGEAESSSESSAESIKVKKVVDSAVADGAGEPDVVPPVVVATS